MVLTVTGEKLHIVVQKDLIVDKVRELRKAKTELAADAIINDLIAMDEELETMEKEK